MEEEQKNQWRDEFIQSWKQETFVKMLLSKPTTKNTHVIKIRIHPVEIQRKKMLCFVFEHPTKTITKNYTFSNALDTISYEVGVHFKNAMLYTTQKDIRLSYNKKMKASMAVSKASIAQRASLQHDKEKKRYISLENSIYLQRLGITNANGEMVRTMSHKWKQINKYLETIERIVREMNITKEKHISIVDMGSGKGYLTFAMYDYLVHTLQLNVKIVGVELRKELVDFCTGVAQESGFTDLHFEAKNIEHFASEEIDILIALHACDTATDDAMYQGITKNASVIITAPCCHKQIRKEMKTETDLNLVMQHGILQERQAEICTDAMRGSVLEEHGYRTKIFEFIADAHTHKNVMIVGIKKEKSMLKPQEKEKRAVLKKILGVQNFYLEELFT